MESKITAKEIYKIFDENEKDKTKEQMINMAVKQHGISEATAKMHYTNWKREYVKPGYIEKVHPVIQEEKIKFKPMMIQGNHAVYSLDKSGVTLVSPGQTLTYDFIKEQMEAMNLWKEHYSSSEVKAVV